MHFSSLRRGTRYGTSNEGETMRAIHFLSSAIALTAVLAPAAAAAQDTAEVKKLTILTFNAPVQLPGKTLPAGKYRFEMADTHTVRVLSEDGQKVHGMFPTVASTLPKRDLRDQDTVLMFS